MNKGKGSSNKSGVRKGQSNKSQRGSFKGKSGEGSAKKLKAGAKGRSKYIDHKNRQKKGDPLPNLMSDEVRLNKFIANAGICSRREADVLIQTGVVSVNGEVVTEMGYKVKPGDTVQYDGETVSLATKRYVLLNKPKGFYTELDDPMGRKNVVELIKKVCKEVVYPMDRMTKDTTGLMLFTNDTDLAKKLGHPKHKPLKLYHVTLNQPIRAEDLEKLRGGVRLDDGSFHAEQVEIVDESEGYEVGIAHRSGQKQAVQRVIESLGYKVKKLDRVSYAGLTKKDLPRGYSRHLTEKEVAFLKMNT